METTAENRRNLPKVQIQQMSLPGFKPRKSETKALAVSLAMLPLAVQLKGRLSAGTILIFTKPGVVSVLPIFTRLSLQSLGRHRISHSFSRILPPQRLFLYILFLRNFTIIPEGQNHDREKCLKKLITKSMGASKKKKKKRFISKRESIFQYESFHPTQKRKCA